MVIENILNFFVKKRNGQGSCLERALYKFISDFFRGMKNEQDRQIERKQRPISLNIVINIFKGEKA